VRRGKRKVDRTESWRVARMVEKDWKRAGPRESEKERD
jgi:hypothetical protein